MAPVLDPTKARLDQDADSASVSGSCWVKVFTGSLRASSITVYDTTLDWQVIFVLRHAQVPIMV